MDSVSVEVKYPLSFREDDAKILGGHLRHRHSVDLVGMKRVGISNFLRYFLYHEKVKETFISANEKYLFIAVDLNDLVERELYAFWTLTFKRIIDEVERSSLPEATKQKIATSFLSSIQTHDLFLLIDGVRQALNVLVKENIYPTIFFLRFDRIKNAVSPEFFDNLQGLRDATNSKLCYVFTSYRSLDALSPGAFSKADLSTYFQTMYIRPLNGLDLEMIAQYYKERYRLDLDKKVEQKLFELVGGNVQYLQTALILLSERKNEPVSAEELEQLLAQDERITLLSEELWESLTSKERDVLGRVCKGEKLGEEERKAALYVFETGMVKEGRGSNELFSPLFGQYVSLAIHHVTQREKELVFSKKEHMLFTLLQDHTGQICERDDIIEAVWPEYRDFGVSDWSIDRLVARVRSKLKKQSSMYEIRTIRTRGYMLTERV